MYTLVHLTLHVKCFLHLKTSIQMQKSFLYEADVTRT